MKSDYGQIDYLFLETIMLSISISCPHCFEWQTLAIAPDDMGVMHMDCGVCCRGIQLRIWVDEEGEVHCSAERAW